MAFDPVSVEPLHIQCRLLQAKEVLPVTEDNQFERLAETITPLCEVTNRLAACSLPHTQIRPTSFNISVCVYFSLSWTVKQWPN